MKFARILVFALFAPWIAQNAALAGNEGPHGMPPRMPRPASSIAELRDEGAVVPNPVRTTVRIKTNGQIWMERENDATLVGTLSPGVTQALSKEAETARPSELIDRNEGEPYCAGSGRVSYLVFQQGKEIEVGATLSCHELRSKEGGGATVIRVLKAARALAELAPASERLDEVAPDAPRVLAQLTQAGGLRPPGAPRSRGLRILRSGDIAQFVDNAETTWLTLSSERLATLTALVERIPALPLPEIDRTRGCMDAPFTTYEAVHSDGERILLSQTMRCIRSSAEDVSARSVTRLLSLLDSVR